MNATVYPAPDGWRWRIVADNGEIIATGESYVRRRDAEDVLALLVRTLEVDVTIRNHGNTVTDHYKIGLYGTSPAPGFSTTEGIEG